jgi:hypothetical protein
MIRGRAARQPGLSGRFTGFSQANAAHLSAAPYPDVHTGDRRREETAAHFRDSSLVSARDPSLPRVARFLFAAAIWWRSHV